MPDRVVRPPSAGVMLAASALLVALLGAGDCSAQDTPSPAPCRAQAHRQFDFWIGDWEVFQPDGKKAGENRIVSIAAGCALQEFWSGRGGVTGTSLNSFDRTDNKWHQTWVDSGGERLELTGGREGESMVMASTSPHPQRAGVSIIQKITWTPAGDGSVRQFWQASEDSGKTWTTLFDGKYVRKR